MGSGQGARWQICVLSFLNLETDPESDPYAAPAY